jgi:hypothetical protein
VHSTKFLTKYEKKGLPQNCSRLLLVSFTPLINIHRDYFREFSNNFVTIPMRYSGAQGTLFYEKKPVVENLVSEKEKKR